MKRAGALAVGLLLASLPFLLYGPRGHTHAPHTDHAPRHGGQLFMIGDHHVEVVSLADRVEIYLSDASRRPLRPAAGVVELQGGGELPLQWSGERLMLRLEAGMRSKRYLVTAATAEDLPLDARALLRR